MPTRGPASTVNVQELSLRHISDIVSGVGSNTVINAPGLNQRIVVTSFVVQNEEEQTAITVILRDGGHNHWRVSCPQQGDGLSKDFAVGREWRLSENTALNIYLSAAGNVGYSIAYSLERV